MKVAVTGASGFVGGVVCQALCDAGHQPVPLVRRPSDLEGARLLARFERSTLREALRGCEAVVHAASVVHRRGAPLEEYVDFNVRGTEALCKAAVDAGVQRLVFVSSVKVYGEGPFERVTEETPVASNPGYAATKLEAEHIVRAHDPELARGSCILRLAPVYGVGDKGNVRSMIVNAARRTLAIPGSGHTQKSLVHVSKVAGAVVRAAASSERGVYLIADPHAPSMRELADAITDALGKRPAPSLPIAPFVLLARAVDRARQLLGRSPLDVTALLQKSQFRTVFDPGKYERTFAHSLHTDLDGAIREEVEWLRRSGRIG